MPGTSLIAPLVGSPWIGAGLSYLAGSIPTSYLVCRWAGAGDLRALGSNNPGATNLYRVLGMRYALPVALVDIAKGAMPLLWAGGEGEQAAYGLLAVIGHMFPIWLGFRGGKGVATAAGAVLGLAPGAALGAALIWGGLVWAARIVSLASILAALALPGLVWLLSPGRPVTLALSALIAVAVVAAHRSNLRRLWAGTEPRIARLPGRGAGEG